MANVENYCLFLSLSPVLYFSHVLQDPYLTSQRSHHQLIIQHSKLLQEAAEGGSLIPFP